MASQLSNDAVSTTTELVEKSEAGVQWNSRASATFVPISAQNSDNNQKPPARPVRRRSVSFTLVQRDPAGEVCVLRKPQHCCNEPHTCSKDTTGTADVAMKQPPQAKAMVRSDGNSETCMETEQRDNPVCSILDSPRGAPCADTEKAPSGLTDHALVGIEKALADALAAVMADKERARVLHEKRCRESQRVACRHSTQLLLRMLKEGRPMRDGDSFTVPMTPDKETWWFGPPLVDDNVELTLLFKEDCMRFEGKQRSLFVVQRTLQDVKEFQYVQVKELGLAGGDGTFCRYCICEGLLEGSLGFRLVVNFSERVEDPAEDLLFDFEKIGQEQPKPEPRQHWLTITSMMLVAPVLCFQAKSEGQYEQHEQNEQHVQNEQEPENEGDAKP
eukprot:scpid31951/ scgid17402/ 